MDRSSRSTALTCCKLSKPDPGQLVLVVMEMQEPRARDRRECPHRLEVRLTLELDGAGKAANGPGLEPFPYQREQARRIADDVREQPIHAPHRSWVDRKGAFEALFDVGQARDRGIESRLVDAEHLRAEPLQHPGPAARAGAEIDAEIAGTGASV